MAAGPTPPAADSIAIGWQDGKDSAIRVWDVETGQEVRKLEGHKGIVWSVAVSPDGRRVLSGGHDLAPILWDAKTGAEIRRFRGHTDLFGCVAFLPMAGAPFIGRRSDDPALGRGDGQGDRLPPRADE